MNDVSPEKAAARGRQDMKIFVDQRGKIGWALLWLIGVPVPVLMLLFFVRGCT